ncbi:MAG: membrane protein insertase YidC [Planctomycetota bacterium]|jgi:YidC/Oxa1 family membrane protein insertase
MSNNAPSSNTDTLRNVIISVAVALGFLYFVPKIMPPPPQNQQTADQQTSPETVPGTPTSAGQGNAGPPTVTGVDPATGATTTGTATAASGVYDVVQAPEIQTVSVGAPEFKDDDQNTEPIETVAIPYRSRLVLSNVGASVDSAYTTDHSQTLGGRSRYELLTPFLADNGKTYRSLSIEKIAVGEHSILLSDKRWNLGPVTESDDGMRAVFELLVTKDGADAFRLTRTYFLPKQPVESQLHDIMTDLQITNLTSEISPPITVTYRGGFGVRREAPRMEDRFIVWGIARPNTQVAGGTRAIADVSKSLEQEIFDPATNRDESFSSAGTINKYFSCTLFPLEPGSTLDKPVPASNVTRVSAVDADSNPLTSDDVTVQIVSRINPIAAGTSASIPVEVYLGKKDGDAFRAVGKYNDRNMYYQVAQSYGSCTFTWLVELMIWLLNSLHAIIGDYGLAIIIMVIIVRGILHPVTKKGQVNMVRMQQKMGEFQPKLEELKKKYGNDKAKMQQETMKLYREEGVNPAGPIFSCLPMALQMPIWFALFISLSNNILMRHEGFLFTWINDLTTPDALYTFATPLVIPLVGWELPSFNLLPILVAVSMYVQQKLQPKPKPNPNASDQQKAQQEMMQKMMPMMSIMMLVFFYNMPAGLNLYIMTSSIFGALEQWYIRNHIKEREESGTLHKKAKAATTRKAPSFIKKLQAMAEEAQKQQLKKNRGKKGG